MAPSSFIPVILGPTACGKTSIGIEIAKNIGGEVISVDSRKIYKGLPIGTATPKGTLRGNQFMVQGVPHYLIGTLSPDQRYTAGDFAKEANSLISQIKKRGKTPVLVGGTGFYFKSLQKGLPALPTRNEDIRIEIENNIESAGLSKIYRQLSDIDPGSAARISKNDRHKIIRALEIYRLTGLPPSQFKDEKLHRKSLHPFVVMGLRFPQALLEDRIKRRSRKMVEEGMIEETESLIKAGHSKSCPALTSFGFKEAVQAIEGKITRDEFLDKLVRGTVAYAKRQRTWFRTQVQPTWFECDENSTAKEISLRMSGFLASAN